jgi:hypothetical protein
VSVFKSKFWTLHQAQPAASPAEAGSRFRFSLVIFLSFDAPTQKTWNQTN